MQGARAWREKHRDHYHTCRGPCDDPDGAGLENNCCRTTVCFLEAADTVGLG